MGFRSNAFFSSSFFSLSLNPPLLSPHREWHLEWVYFALHGMRLYHVDCLLPHFYLNLMGFKFFISCTYCCCCSFPLFLCSCYIVFTKLLSFNFLYIYQLLLILSGDIELNPGPPQSKLRQCRFLYSNIRGLYSNIKDLSIVSRQYDILFCTETLVSDMRHISELLIPGFKKPILLKRNSIPRACGMAIYVREGYSASRNHLAECGCHEVQVMKVCGRLHNFYLFSIYRNPDLDDSIFDCLLSSMASIQGSDRKASFIFVGDFNAHHRDWLNSVSQTDCHGVAALDFATQSGCEQLIAGPTHRSGNCLDLLLTDSSGIVAANVGLPVGTSDHNFVSARIKINQFVPNVSFSRKIYLKSRADWDSICDDLLSLDWNTIYRNDDVASCLNDHLVNIIERRVPSRILRFRVKDKAWFNDECRRAYNEKQSAYRLWSNNRSDLCWRNFTRLRAEAQSIYDAAERDYNNSVKETLSSTNQPHKWWTTLKTALFGADSTMPPLRKADGSITYCSKEKADLLAEIFDKKQSNESIILPPTCFPEVKLSSFAFRSREVEHLLLDLDNHGGMDPDGIFPLFLTKNAHVLAPKIATILRNFVRAGSFSSFWRKGNITPMSKGVSSSSDPSEYRPISITPILSKVFERLLSKRISRFVESNHQLPDLQFGFRKGRGTCDALLTISSNLQRALDYGHEARVVGLDFSAAFDRVNHLALIYKLKLLGIGGSILNILTEFLTRRTQRVVVDGQLSDIRYVVSGVPQGSVLGPLLFIIYTSDMWLDLENKLIAYADDATLVASIPSPGLRSSVAESLNRDLERINDWCKRWGMKLNPLKTQSMIISRSRTLYPQHPDLRIDNAVLVTSNSFKILGVTFDSKLTFEKHIRNVASGISQKVGILRKCFRVFGNETVLLHCFNSFILPCLEYCAPVWSSAADSHLKLLDSSLSTIKFLLPNLKIDLWHRRLISSLCMLHKVYYCLAHPLHASLPDLSHPVRSTRQTAAANSVSFSSIRYNTNQYSRCFIPAATKVWNTLPSAVVESVDIQRFKVGANSFLIK